MTQSLRKKRRSTGNKCFFGLGGPGLHCRIWTDIEQCLVAQECPVRPHLKDGMRNSKARSDSQGASFQKKSHRWLELCGWARRIGEQAGPPASHSESDWGGHLADWRHTRSCAHPQDLRRLLGQHRQSSIVGCIFPTNPKETVQAQHLRKHQPCVSIGYFRLWKNRFRRLVAELIPVGDLPCEDLLAFVLVSRPNARKLG